MLLTISHFHFRRAPYPYDPPEEGNYVFCWGRSLQIELEFFRVCPPLWFFAGGTKSQIRASPKSAGWPFPRFSESLLLPHLCQDGSVFGCRFVSVSFCKLIAVSKRSVNHSTRGPDCYRMCPLIIIFILATISHVK